MLPQRGASFLNFYCTTGRNSPIFAWEAPREGDSACLASGEVDSKSTGSEDDDGKGQEQEDEAVGPVGTRGGSSHRSGSRSGT